MPMLPVRAAGDRRAVVEVNPLETDKLAFRRSPRQSADPAEWMALNDIWRDHGFDRQGVEDCEAMVPLRRLSRLALRIRNLGGERMQPNNEEERQQLIQRADALEKSLTQTEELMVRTETLIRLVEEVANDLDQLAEDWEAIDRERAERWRNQARQVRSLSEEFGHLEEMEAKEAKTIIGSLREMVRRRH